MGLLVDGVWQDRWYDTGKLAGGSSALKASSATGSPRTEALGRPALAASPPNPIATTSMSLSPARGRTEPDLSRA